MVRPLRARGRQGFCPRSLALAKGFTLLELIIVLAVLAALAALVVPILGWVRDQAKFASAAAGAAEVLNNLETYKSATGRYPDRFDSLHNEAGTVYTKLAGATGGNFAYGTSGPAGSAGYYLSNGGGITQLMPHRESTVASDDPNASTELTTPIAIGTSNLLIFDGTSQPYYEAKMRRIIRAAFPNQTGDGNNLAIPAGHTLVALGVGSRTSTTGTTMTSAPVSTTGAQGKYGRFIAIFDVSAGGTGRGKVQLKLVVDSEFEVLAKNVANYQGSGPTDDQGVYVPPPPEEEEED